MNWHPTATYLLFAPPVTEQAEPVSILWSFAIPGFVKNFCTPNALLTFEEYLMDLRFAKNKRDR